MNGTSGGKSECRRGLVGEALPYGAQRRIAGGQRERDPLVATGGQVADLRRDMGGEAVAPAAAAVVEFPAGQVRLAEPEHGARRDGVEDEALRRVMRVCVPHEQHVLMRREFRVKTADVTAGVVAVERHVDGEQDDP